MLCRHAMYYHMYVYMYMCINVYIYVYIYICIFVCPPHCKWAKLQCKRFSFHAPLPHYRSLSFACSKGASKRFEYIQHLKLYVIPLHTYVYVCVYIHSVVHLRMQTRLDEQCCTCSLRAAVNLMYLHIACICIFRCTME